MINGRTCRYAWDAALAAHEYYHGSGQSHLPDSNYDGLVRYCAERFNELSPTLMSLWSSPGSMSHTGMHVRMTPTQREGVEAMLEAAKELDFDLANDLAANL